MKCSDCDAQFKIPIDAVKGEIISCLDCGLEMEVIVDKGGNRKAIPLIIEGEDWGE
jgi:alpha-aminoadipate carrier protein LysW